MRAPGQDSVLDLPMWVFRGADLASHNIVQSSAKAWPRGTQNLVIHCERAIKFIALCGLTGQEFLESRQNRRWGRPVWNLDASVPKIAQRGSWSFLLTGTAVCGRLKAIAPGAQTERPGEARPVRASLGGKNLTGRLTLIRSSTHVSILGTPSSAAMPNQASRWWSRHQSKVEVT